MKKIVSAEDFDNAIQAKDAEIAYLREQVALLKKALFAAKSERRPLIEKLLGTIDLFDVQPDNGTVAESPSSEEVRYTRKKRSADQGRTALPEHLERRVEIIELPEEERQCPECGSVMREIGEDVTEELEIIPMQVLCAASCAKSTPAQPTLCMACSAPACLRGPFPRASRGRAFSRTC